MTRTLVAAFTAALLLVAAQRPVSGTTAETWVNVTGSLAHKMSECGTLTYLSPVPKSDAVIAGVAARGLWVNISGTTWSRLGDAEGSERISNRPTWIVYDPKDPNVFWASGAYGETGIYKTTDGGKTFRRLGNIGHKEFASGDFPDPQR